MGVCLGLVPPHRDVGVGLGLGVGVAAGPMIPVGAYEVVRLLGVPLHVEQKLLPCMSEELGWG